MCSKPKSLSSELTKTDIFTQEIILKTIKLLNSAKRS